MHRTALWWIVALLAWAGCDCARSGGQRQAEDQRSVGGSAGESAAGAAEQPAASGGAPEVSAPPDTLAAFLRWTHPRIASDVFYDHFGAQLHRCGAQASQMFCHLCLDGRTEDVCDDETYGVVCERSPVYPRGVAGLAATPVACTEGARMQCWSELPGIDNSIQPPVGFRLTWYFEDGELVGQARGERGSAPSLDPRASADQVREVCELTRTMVRGEVAVGDRLGLFVHRFWYPDPETRTRNGEQHLCGPGVQEWVQRELGALSESDLSACALGPPVSCVAAYSHAETAYFATDRGEGAQPRLEVFAVAFLGSALSEPYGERQERELQAFLDRVRAGEPPPRRAGPVLSDGSRSGPRIAEDLAARITDCP